MLDNSYMHTVVYEQVLIGQGTGQGYSNALSGP